MANIRLVILAFFMCTYSFSQGGSYVCEVNRTNGTFTPLGQPILNTYWSPIDQTTYNSSTGTYFFNAQHPTIDSFSSLYGVTVPNGIVTNAPYSVNMSFFAADDANHVYCLYFTNLWTWSTIKFGYIDTVTGLYTQISNAPDLTGNVYPGNCAFDVLNNQYVVINWPYNGAQKKLYAIDATTGNILLNTNLILSGDYILTNIAIDYATGDIFGQVISPSQPDSLVKIDKQTGMIQKIGPGYSGPPSATTTGKAVFDSVNQQYIYLVGSNYNYTLTTLDVVTGNPVFQTLINPVLSQGRIHGLELDKATNKLYMLYSTLQLLNTEEIEKAQNIAIYPNPFDTAAFLEIGNYQNEVYELSIYNANGLLVSKIENIRSPKTPINAERLSSGMYFYTLKSANDIVKSGKFLMK